MKISVIIPTYKPQSYLWECLDSLVNQTFSKEYFEVILVLNGCEEPYKSDIDEYISTKMQGMHINFIHTLKGGVSNARNIALDHTRGEYVTFIDDDDFVSPNYLELLYENVNKDTISLCYPYAYKDGDLTTQIYYPITEVYEECHRMKNINISSKLRKYFSGPWMKLIPMSFIQDRRFDLRFTNGEDSLFMFSISDNFKKFAFTNRTAVYYRRYRINSSVTRKRKISHIINDGWLLINEYTRIWLRSPRKFNILFYIQSILSTIKGTIKYCIKNL